MSSERINEDEDPNEDKSAVSEQLEAPASEHGDIPVSEQGDIPVSEHGDVPVSEHGDIPVSENVDAVSGQTAETQDVTPEIKAKDPDEIKEVTATSQENVQEDVSVPQFEAESTSKVGTEPSDETEASQLEDAAVEETEREEDKLDDEVHDDYDADLYHEDEVQTKDTNKIAEEETNEKSEYDMVSELDAGFFDDDPMEVKDQGSMTTEAGSYPFSESEPSTLSSSSSGYGMPPKSFQEYVKKYSDLFGARRDMEEEPCDEEAGRAFLKIDVQKLISGYKSQDELANDAKAAISGITRVRHDIIQMEDEPIILRSDYKEYKGVRSLSGGHMGNEPLYIEYVGKGMLTGVVLGTICDPPSVATVTRAMRELITESSGLLIVIHNNVEYRLIFGLAMERIRMEGHINVDMVVVGDDCYERCKSPVGRRGLAGIVLIYKLVGSMADSEKTLRDIYIAARCAARSQVTISCMTKPFKAIGTGLDKNSKDGIHFNGDTCSMITRMIDYCLHPMRYFSIRLDPEDKLIVFINYYRTKSPEFYTVVNHVIEELMRRKVAVERIYADNFVTGFWPGYSITLMIDCNHYRVKYLDCPTTVTVWPRNPSDGSNKIGIFRYLKHSMFNDMGPILTFTEEKVVKNAVVTACKSMLLCENVLNAMHFFGNYGTKLRIGAEALLQAIRHDHLKFNRPFNLLIDISEILIEKLPGVVGAMYGCLFEGAARSFVRSPLTKVSAQSWSEAMDEALKTLRSYTNAKGGIVSLALSLIPVVMAIHGPYISLPQDTTRDPIICALDSLRHEIEDRMKQTGNEKEMLFRNQLDVESYALIIWLHAIYSSVYWKLPSETPSDRSETVDLSQHSKESGSKLSAVGRRRSSQKSKTSKASQKSNIIDEISANIKGINEPLQFLTKSAELLEGVPSPAEGRKLSQRSNQTPSKKSDDDLPSPAAESNIPT